MYGNANNVVRCCSFQVQSGRQKLLQKYVVLLQRQLFRWKLLAFALSSFEKARQRKALPRFFNQNAWHWHRVRPKKRGNVKRCRAFSIKRLSIAVHTGRKSAATLYVAALFRLKWSALQIFCSQCLAVALPWARATARAKARKSQEWCKYDARRLQGGCIDAARKLQGSYKDAARLLQGGCKDVAMMLQG